MDNNEEVKVRGRKSPSFSSTGRPSSQRKVSTKELLIDIGEYLFGQKGFDGISLREIAATAGQSNSNVVQYHFDDKAGLIAAILEDRVERVEHVRRMQLDILDPSSLNVRQLIKVLWLPLMSIKDEEGNHSFCRFMLQYNMMHPKVAPHPFSAFYEDPYLIDSEIAEKLASGREVTKRLIECFPELPKNVLITRLGALATMFFCCVLAHDNKRVAGLIEADLAFDIEPILDMALGALTAPETR